MLYLLTAHVDEETVDVTDLKHYLHKVNLYRTNPPLFKRISDLATESNFTATWTLEQMTAFFLEHAANNESKQKTKQMPTFDLLVSLFESLDSDLDGQLEAKDLRVLIQNFWRIAHPILKDHKQQQERGDMDGQQNKSASEGGVDGMDMGGAGQEAVLQGRIQVILAELDINQKGRISPEEFFNIVASLYE